MNREIDDLEEICEQFDPHVKRTNNKGARRRKVPMLYRRSNSKTKRIFAALNGWKTRKSRTKTIVET